MIDQLTTGRTVMQGTGLVIGPHGILITGPSGAGKSLLALDLLDHAQGRGEEAVLVADDGIVLTAGADGPVMTAPRTIAGMIELRGRGIVNCPHRASAPLHLWVELVEGLERMPGEEAFSGALAGIVVARCPVPRRGVADPIHQRLLVRAALVALG